MTEAAKEFGVPAYAIRLFPRVLPFVTAEFERITNQSGELVARDWKDGLIEAIASLATVGASLPTVPESGASKRGYRQLLYKRRPYAPTYRILFVVEEETLDAPTIRVLQIRHGARKPLSDAESKRLLNEDYAP